MIKTFLLEYMPFFGPMITQAFAETLVSPKTLVILACIKGTSNNKKLKCI